MKSRASKSMTQPPLQSAVNGKLMGYLMSKKTWLACRVVSKSHLIDSSIELVHYLENQLQPSQHRQGQKSCHVVDTWIRILAFTSERGDGNAIRCLLKGLRDWRLWIQCTCLDRLPNVVCKGDPDVESALIQYARRKDEDNVELAGPSVQFVDCMTSREECKFAALKCLTKVGDPNSEQVVSLMLDNLLFTYVEDNGAEYWQEPQHMPAVDGLVEFGRVGDEGVIDRLLSSLHEGNRVFSALAKLTNRGNAKVIEALLKLMPSFHCIEGIHYQRSTCNAAYAALKLIVEPCDQKVIGDVVALLGDPNIWQDAYRAVRKATHEGHVQGINLDVCSIDSDSYEGKRHDSAVDTSSDSSESEPTSGSDCGSSFRAIGRVTTCRKAKKGDTSTKTNVVEQKWVTKKILKRPSLHGVSVEAKLSNTKLLKRPASHVASRRA